MANNPKNWNDQTPAPPTDFANVIFQAEAPDDDSRVRRNASAYMPIVEGDGIDLDVIEVGYQKFLVISAIPGGGSDFTDLGDVPGSYSGAANKVVTVKSDETGLEFTTQTGGGGGSSNASAYRRRGFVSSGGQDGSVGIAAGQGMFGDLATVMGVFWTQDVAASFSSPKRGQSTEIRNTSAGASGGLKGAPLWVAGFNIQGMFDIALQSVVDVTLWAGYTDGNASSWGVGSNPAGNYAAFRFDPINGDTKIQCVTKDGSTQTVVDSGVTPTTDAMRLSIVFDDTVPNVKFYIDGALVATITTHLPASGTVLRYNASVAWASSQHSIYISHIETSADY